jgi:hypothetical protein
MYLGQPFPKRDLSNCPGLWFDFAHHLETCRRADLLFVRCARPPGLAPTGFRFKKHPLISVPSGDGRNPSLLGGEKIMVLWSRAAVQIRSAHEDRPEGALGMDSKIPEKGALRCGCGSCARPDPTNCSGARVDDSIGESRTRPRPCVCFTSSTSGHQHDRAVVEGHQFSGTPSGVCAFAKDVLGQGTSGLVDT